MDKNKLLYFIKDRGYTLDDFFAGTGIARTTFYRKCHSNGFTVKDIWNIAEFLGLSTEDINSIFFAKQVSR